MLSVPGHLNCSQTMLSGILQRRFLRGHGEQSQLFVRVVKTVTMSQVC